MSDYPVPQRVFHRCGEKLDEISEEKTGLPDIVPPLFHQIAAAVKVHDYEDDTYLWIIQFHWPLTAATQKTIAGAIHSLNSSRKWRRNELPTTIVDVPTVDADGNIVVVQMSLKLAAARHRFVGEVVNPATGDLISEQ